MLFSLRRWWPIPVTAAALMTGCTSFSPLRPSSYLTASDAAPGSPAWWKQNKKRAVFVPGEGFQVDGVDGYFDEKGRPIQAVAPVSFNEEPTGIQQLDPKYAYARVKTAVGKGPNQQIAAEEFAEGQSLYQQKRYAEATEHFATAANRATDAGLKQDSMFLLAEAQFFDDKYPAANDAYLELINQFPSTKYLDKTVARQSSIARYWHDLHNEDPSWPITPNLFDKKRPRFDTLGNALKIYESIRLNDPTGPLADDALMATANTHFVRGRWDDADYHYGLLRREYPNSPHQLNAHLLGLQCKLRKYQGADYDATPLEEAEQLAKQLRVQFGHELPDGEQPRIQEIEARIVKHRATRDWKTAQFYEDRDYITAARYYYKQLIEAHPGTELAQQASVRLAEIRDRPGVPPERFGLIMQVFPESSERTAISAASKTVKR